MPWLSSCQLFKEAKVIEKVTKTHLKKGASHEDQLKRINRIEGQVRGIAGMIQDQRYCTDILQQIKAVKSALTAIELNIIDGHLNHCVQKAVNSKKLDETQEVVDEIGELLRRWVK